MTSAEQAVGKAAPVVSIKSENGQNASNPQTVVSWPASSTHVLHNTGTGHLVHRKPLHMLDSAPSLRALGRKTALLGCKHEGSASARAVAEPRDASSGQDHDRSRATQAGEVTQNEPSPGAIQNRVF